MIIRHLIPNSRVWRLSGSKRLTLFLKGLQDWIDSIHDHIGLILLDLHPLLTRELEKWEDEFLLQAGDKTDIERRQQLLAQWRMTGGQSPYYIQSVLQSAGFNVCVSEWWETPISRDINGCVVAKDPLDFIADGREDIDGFAPESGELLMQSGEESAQANNYVDAFVAPTGYVLVNKIPKYAPDYIVLAGENYMQAGENVALAGNFLEYKWDVEKYRIPTHCPNHKKGFYYISGCPFPTIAQIPESRRDEFEQLILRISPAQLWAGILVEYN